MEKAEFAKTKEIDSSKIEAERNKNQLDRETFEKESKNTAERLRLANEELENARKEFEKYKDVEKQKLELESTNLSQSVARFKELVSQFNSGFKDISGREQEQSLEDLTKELEPSEEITEDKPSIRKIFDAANDSVKSATQIFDKCVALKTKLDDEKKE